VLLVEDNQISQKLLKKQLVRAGCSVVTANDGVEAVEYFMRNAAHNRSGTDDSGNSDPRIELILMGKSSSCTAGQLSLIQLDIEMPRKGGLEATQDIRSMEASGISPSRIPIIAVSANARSGQIESVRCPTHTSKPSRTSAAVLIPQMLNAGMNGFVSKPFQMTELLSKIEALTGKRPGQRQT